MPRLAFWLSGVVLVICIAVPSAWAHAPSDAVVGSVVMQNAGASAEQMSDRTLAVPWNGTFWRSMPNFTWAACDVSENTRRAINLAFGQWAFAAANQGIPIQFSELPCSNGISGAQIRIFEASSTDLPATVHEPGNVFGLTLAKDASDRICTIGVLSSCEAVSAELYLFSDNWETKGLTYTQAAKTVANRVGAAIGLGYAHFCNFDSVMARNCEPILKGLGPDDIESIDVLVDQVRSYFHESPLNVRPTPPTPEGGGTTVTYHAGYNLVGGPRGTLFSAASGSLYTLLPGDSGFRTILTVQPTYDGYGYWAYFPQDVTVQMNGRGASFYSVDAPADQWFLLGNEIGSLPMRVLGADAVYVYDAESGQYQSASALQPGQAAWVKSNQGGTVSVVSTALSGDQITCYLNLGSPSSC